MIWRNVETGEYYSKGGLKTKDGTIFNPTEAVLRKYGYEVYTPPQVEAVKVEPSELRRQAYEAECDPLLIASLGYTMEGDDDAAAACRALYLAKKREIRERIPDEEEQQ